jgi:hypothetical protein
MSDGMDGEFSRLFKQMVRENRHKDFEDVKSWLKENKINFVEKMFEVYLVDKYITIYPNMKVNFGTSLKRYQYNIEGLKNRLTKD